VDVEQYTTIILNKEFPTTKTYKIKMNTNATKIEHV
jgi:hypothetical protein